MIASIDMFKDDDGAWTVMLATDERVGQGVRASRLFMWRSDVHASPEAAEAALTELVGVLL